MQIQKNVEHIIFQRMETEGTPWKADVLIIKELGNTGYPRARTKDRNVSYVTNVSFAKLRRRYNSCEALKLELDFNHPRMHLGLVFSF